MRDERRRRRDERRLERISARYLRRQPDVANSLVHDDVNVLHKGAGGVLWIGTDGGGLARYETVGQRFVNYPLALDEGAGGLASGFVTALHEGPDGTVWIGTAGGGVHRSRLADRRRPSR